VTTPAIEDRSPLPLAADCCAPLLREPLTAAQAADLARTLKALADSTRLRLVSMVAAISTPAAAMIAATASETATLSRRRRACARASSMST
jgi:hypothetical protein